MGAMRRVKSLSLGCRRRDVHACAGAFCSLFATFLPYRAPRPFLPLPFGRGSALVLMELVATLPLEIFASASRCSLVAFAAFVVDDGGLHRLAVCGNARQCATICCIGVRYVFHLRCASDGYVFA